MILECPVTFGHSIAAEFLWNDLITLLTFLTLSSSGMNILSDLNNVEIIYSQFSRCVMLVGFYNRHLPFDFLSSYDNCHIRQTHLQAKKHMYIWTDEPINL